VLTQENPLFIISNVTVPLISNGNVDDIIDILNGENTSVVISVIEKSNPTLQFFEGVTVGVTGNASNCMSKLVIVAEGVGTGSQSQSKYAKKLS
jgi:ribosomal protein L19